MYTGECRFDRVRADHLAMSSCGSIGSSNLQVRIAFFGIKLSSVGLTVKKDRLTVREKDNAEMNALKTFSLQTRWK